LLIAAGGLVLLYRRIITWHIPVAMLAGIAIPAAIAHSVDPTRYLDVSTHLLSGGALLGAFFIATDYVTSPNTKIGQLVFAAGCGFLTYVIRTWGGYPEGVAFAVLLMNALTPVIINSTPAIINDQWYNLDTITFNWSVPADAEGVDYTISTNSNLQLPDVSQGLVSQTNYDLSKFSDGIWYFFVSFNSGNAWSPPAVFSR